jgi:hypothetical protein
MPFKHNVRKVPSVYCQGSTMLDYDRYKLFAVEAIWFHVLFLSQSCICRRWMLIQKNSRQEKESRRMGVAIKSSKGSS